MVGMCTFVHFPQKEITKVEYKLKKKDVIIVPNKKQEQERGSFWTKKKKIAAGVIGAGFLALVIFVVLIFVFDLGPVREIESSEEDARAVGDISGYEVRFEELRYITLLHREELDAKYGKYDTLTADKKAEYEKELESIVLENIKSNYVILSLCEKYGVDTDSKEARNYVKEAIEDLVDEAGGRNEYAEWLRKNDLTDALLRFIYKINYLEGALLEQLTINKEEIKYTTANLDDFVKFVMEDESYAKVIHAFFPKEHDLYSQRGSNMNIEVNKALEKINGAEDDKERYELMKDVIGNAPYVLGYSVEGMGSYITYGQMHEDYEDAVFGLEDYGISKIELEEGCYIIMRMPKVRDEVARHAYDYIEYYRYAVLKQLEDEQREKIKFNGNEYFGSISLIDIK